MNAKLFILLIYKRIKTAYHSLDEIFWQYSNTFIFSSFLFWHEHQMCFWGVCVKFIGPMHIDTSFCFVGRCAHVNALNDVCNEMLPFFYLVCDIWAVRIFWTKMRCFVHYEKKKTNGFWFNINETWNVWFKQTDQILLPCALTSPSSKRNSYTVYALVHMMHSMWMSMLQCYDIICMYYVSCMENFFTWTCTCTSE